jgi:signal transduction histidine kinase
MIEDKATLEDKAVLIVDDSRPTRRFLEALVRGFGMRPTTAEDAASALAAWQPGRFDLILLDLVLPDGDGLQVLRTIRETDQAVCIVLVTGQGDVQTAIEAVREGADGYIDKDELMRQAQQATFRHHLERSLSLREGIRARRELELMRADLYAMVTHDLRHPLHIIQTATQALLNPKLPLTEESRRDLIQMIAESVGSLIKQLDDFLEYTKIDAGFLKLQPTEMDLAAVCRNAVGRAEVLAQNKKQTIELNLPADLPPVYADARRVEQVLANLLSNAIKYTPEGGRITVAAMADGSHARVTVTDTGMGIAAEDLPLLFQRYRRGSGEKIARIKGTGLGLLIVKQIVEAHGGTVWAESQEGQGSTFGFTLPLFSPHPSPSLQETETSQAP